MIKIGQHNILFALRETSVGFYLGDGEDNEVLLPNKYVPEDLEIDDQIMVFVYPDHERRPVATTIEPAARLNEFASLQVKHVSNVGAFLDWGLEKDLFVPFREQAEEMIEGNWYIVRPYLDDVTGRIAATSRRNRFLEFQDVPLEPGEEVDLLICEPTEIGFRVVINNCYAGLIYKNEVFRKLKMGEQTKGFVKELREGNKVDVALQMQGYGNVEPNARLVMEAIEENNGFLDLTDKSDPNEIRERLEMSKKTFKKAIGALYRQRLVLIEPNGIRLVK